MSLCISEPGIFTFLLCRHQKKQLLCSLDRGCDIAQTATALGIADFAGALAGLNPRVDLLDDGARPFLQEFLLDAARRVAEAVADEDIGRVRVFLVNPLAQVVFAVDIAPIAKIDDFAALGGTESIGR